MAVTHLTNAFAQKVVLSIFDPNEYVLVYDNGRAYCAFHKSFVPQFEAVFRDWLEGKQIANPGQDYYTGRPIIDIESTDAPDFQSMDADNKANTSLRTSPRSSSTSTTLPTEPSLSRPSEHSAETLDRQRSSNSNPRLSGSKPPPFQESSKHRKEGWFQKLVRSA